MDGTSGQLTLDTASGVPIYRQIVDWVKLGVARARATASSIPSNPSLFSCNRVMRLAEAMALNRRATVPTSSGIGQIPFA